MDTDSKKRALCEIMGEVHALAEIAWPDATPQDAVRAIIDIQVAAARALGLPENLDLMIGDPRIDLT